MASQGKRVNSLGVLLTYNGVVDAGQWSRFVGHVSANTTQWKVKYWCATMEVTKADGLHFHLFLQFSKLPDRCSRSFVFEDLIPNAECNDALGKGFCKAKLQSSLDEGFFYVWADKIGTQRVDGKECVAGNYFPCWTRERCTYVVKGAWPYNLWRAYQLTNRVYRGYLFKCRDNVLYRKHNLDACEEEETEARLEAETEARVKRIRGNRDIYEPFPVVPRAQEWLATFQKDALRYQIMVVVGASHTGKTEWACSLFKNPLKLKIGELQHFPKAMKLFKKHHHDGVVLDDLRDYSFLVSHQVSGLVIARAAGVAGWAGRQAACSARPASPGLAIVISASRTSCRGSTTVPRSSGRRPAGSSRISETCLQCR